MRHLNTISNIFQLEDTGVIFIVESLSTLDTCQGYLIFDGRDF